MLHPFCSLSAIKRLLNSAVSRRSLVKLAVTGFFTILATRKAPAQPSDNPSTTEMLPHHLPPPALAFTKSPATIQARPDLTLTRDPTRALLVFGAPRSRPQLESSLQPLGLVLEDYLDQCGTMLARPQERVVHAPTQFWIRSLNCQQEITQQTLARLIPIFGQALDWIGPVYKDPLASGRGAFTCAMPNVLLIKLRTGVTPKERRDFSNGFGQFGFQENVNKPVTKFLRHRIRKNSSKTAYELRDQYLSPPWNQVVERVSFSYLPMLSAFAMIPRDNLYRPGAATQLGQWNMWKIQAGENPSACNPSASVKTGWDISRGSPSVVIWLLDAGCDERHPDLNFYSQGMDFRHSSDSSLESSCGQTPRDISCIPDAFKPRADHGTWCAGVLAASIDSSSNVCNPLADGRGVAGVAGGCRVFPLATQENLPSDEFVEAIDYAAANMTLLGGATAKVLSISMGYPWTTDPVTMKHHPQGWFDYEQIEEALTNALAAGIIICAASGNSANDQSSTSIWYPASKSGVMACGASDQSDLRWGGSCYGRELSVVAPGISIPTTHPNSEYITSFDETSAATAHVAGLAALLLSYKPCLTTNDVKNTIEQTADKVNINSYTYNLAGHNGVRNTQVGYGRINVKRALESVRSRCPSDTTPPTRPTGLGFQ